MPWGSVSPTPRSRHQRHVGCRSIVTCTQPPSGQRTWMYTRAPRSITGPAACRRPASPSDSQTHTLSTAQRCLDTATPSQSPLGSALDTK